VCQSVGGGVRNLPSAHDMEAPVGPPPAPSTPPARRGLDRLAARAPAAAATSSPVFRSPDDHDGDSPSRSGLSGIGQAAAEPAPAEDYDPPPRPPYSDEEEDDNEPPEDDTSPPGSDLEEAAPPSPHRGGGRARAERPPDVEWFCHACARSIAAPNDPANPQCGTCGEYFVELVPVAPPPASFGPPFLRRPGPPPLGGPRRADRGRLTDDDDDDEDFADGMGGLMRGGPPRGRHPRPPTEDERMERLLAAVSPPFLFTLCR
jgi:hypothetical protein